jgi:hypothetical protein
LYLSPDWLPLTYWLTTPVELSTLARRRYASESEFVCGDVSWMTVGPSGKGGGVPEAPTGISK